jgi:hypothetical protein
MILDSTAAAVSILGTWLVGCRSSVARAHGFLAYILGSCLFIGWGATIGAAPIVWMHLVYLLLNVRGYISNMREVAK